MIESTIEIFENTLNLYLFQLPEAVQVNFNVLLTVCITTPFIYLFVVTSPTAEFPEA